MEAKGHPGRVRQRSHRADRQGDCERLIGSDLINARERGKAEDDLVDCGPGRDTVLTDNTTENTILANCEVVRRG